MTEIRLNTCINMNDGEEQLGNIRFEEEQVIIEIPERVSLAVDRYVLDELLKRERHASD